MRARLVLLLVAGIALAPAIASAACPTRAGAPSFTVAVKDPPVAYRLDLDSAAVARTAGENGMAGLKGAVPYGLTIGRYDLEVTVDVDNIRDGDRYCAQLRAAHVEIGLKQLDVIVDRRFAAGSCERQAVLDHESTHVGAFREAMRYYVPAIERTLAAAPVSLGVQADARNAARAVFLAPITDSLKPIFAAINARARDANARLDSPENYAAVFARCRHW
ncbi:MAG TPA: hypothetical protein VGL83_03295 [Stellaceae bacterium]